MNENNLITNLITAWDNYWSVVNTDSYTEEELSTAFESLENAVESLRNIKE